MFRLHDRLALDTHEIARLELSRVLLMDDARFPWLVLVPAREGVTEWHQLWDEDQTTLFQETIAASRILEKHSQPDKINLGALGNLVPQLHVHVVARFRKDAAWPAPVWGQGAAEPYGPVALEARLEALGAAFKLEF